ncbi:hypothetical protein LJC48_07015 [Desulfovibrio sp. OttesenSCG-928-C06]|nr:hypothetical protein [Desulfovibrio sp. OttesenSCG-928-C06]
MLDGQQAIAEPRTYNTLNTEELKHLEELEDKYFRAVRDDAVKLVTTFFDTHTIIQTFTPQVRIIRQRKRALLNNVMRYLYRLGLEHEFINNYIDRIYDYALDYAMDGMLQKSRNFSR